MGPQPTKKILGEIGNFLKIFRFRQTFFGLVLDPWNLGHGQLILGMADPAM